MYTSDRRLYLAADGETVVEEGDPRAATLLVGEGGQLSVEDAARYGLTNTRKQSGEKAEAPKSNKVRSAPENK